MTAIQPVHLNNTGAKVATLHKGLLSLIGHQPGVSDHDRAMLRGRLDPEVDEQTYGPVTAEIVGLWQAQLKTRAGLPQDLKDKVKMLPISTTTGRGNGDVDEITAEGLNWLLNH